MRENIWNYLKRIVYKLNFLSCKEHEWEILDPAYGPGQIVSVRCLKCRKKAWKIIND